MNDILEIASRVSTPLALAGLLGALFFFLLRQLLKSEFIPRLGTEQATGLLAKLIDRFFALALMAAMLGFLGFLATVFGPMAGVPGQPRPSPEEVSPPDSLDPPRLRTSYYLIEGIAIDLFLDGGLNDSWIPELSEPFIIQNAVYRAIEELRDSFSARLSLQAVLSVTSDRGGDDDPHRERRYVGDDYFERPFLTLTQQARLELNFSLDNQQFISYVSELWSDSSWVPFRGIGPVRVASEVTSVPYEWLASRRYLDTDEVRAFVSTWLGEASDSEKPKLEYVATLSRDSIPPGFIAIDLFPPQCGYSATVQLIVPDLKLRVMVIENISEAPVTLGTWHTKILRDTGLRPRMQAEAQLGRLPDTMLDLFPPGILLPGERLALPLGMYFGDLRPETDGASTELPVDADRLRDRCLERFPNGRMAIDVPRLGLFDGQVNVPRDTFCDFVSRARGGGPPAPPTLVMYYGPVATVSAVEVDGRLQPVREFDPARLVIKGDIKIGSCPFVYTRSESSQEWVREGTILFGVHSPRLERWDEIALSDFDGSVLIREEELEVSHLDAAELRLTCPGQNPRTFIPNDAGAVTEKDGEYLSLGPGNELLLQFDLEEVPRPCKAVLAVFGYYEPLTADDLLAWLNGRSRR